jgi:hypothetical protein
LPVNGSLAETVTLPTVTIGSLKGVSIRFLQTNTSCSIENANIFACNIGLGADILNCNISASILMGVSNIRGSGAFSSCAFVGSGTVRVDGGYAFTNNCFLQNVSINCPDGFIGGVTGSAAGSGAFFAPVDAINTSACLVTVPATGTLNIGVTAVLTNNNLYGPAGPTLMLEPGAFLIRKNATSCTSPATLSTSPGPVNPWADAFTLFPGPATVATLASLASLNAGSNNWLHYASGAQSALP